MKKLAATVIPVIIGKLTQKTADPNDSSFNIKNVLGSLPGGSDGKFDVSDAIGMFNGGGQAPAANQNGKNPAEGGILDKLKGRLI